VEPIIKEKIEKAIEEFNKYRVPEAIARLISFEEGFFSLEFTGSFCETCGFYDYFDDYRIILEDDMKIETEIKEILETRNGAVVKFQFIK
jgi:superoxide reductase